MKAEKFALFKKCKTISREGTDIPYCPPLQIPVHAGCTGETTLHVYYKSP